MSSGTDPDGEPSHDAVLRVFDASDRLGKKLIAWKWADGRPTISPDEHAEADRLIEQAEDQIDADQYEHGTVIARLWVVDETVERVEWQVEVDDGE